MSDTPAQPSRPRPSSLDPAPDRNGDDQATARLAALLAGQAPEVTEDDEPGEDMRLLNTGRVVLTLDFGTRTAHDYRPLKLDRPRLGEYRELRSLLAQINTEENERRTELGVSDGRPGSIFVYDPTEGLERWMRAAIDALADQEPPADLPYWLTNSNLPMILLNHWRTHPLAPGSRPLGG